MKVTFSCPQCKAPVEAEKTGLKRRMVTCPSCQSNVQVPDDLQVGVGTSIGNGYKLLEKLTDSSLGEVYRGMHESTGREVQVEVLSGEASRDQERVNRLLQEIELVAALRHANIVEAIEAGQDTDTYFLVTSYEPGQTLEDLLENGAVPERDALKYTSDIASALQYAWDEKKILHRDLKPSNIFVTEGGDGKLMGFGIAKSSEGQSLGLTGVGFTIGTPEYMSPEQIKAADDLDFRSDVYALGCVLYEMVTGHLPFEEKAPILLMQKHMDEMPVPPNEGNDNVSPECSALVMKMLAKEREDRHDSWQALLDDIDAVQAGATPGAAAKGATMDAVAAAPKASAPVGGGAPSPAPALPAKGGKKGCAGALAAGFAIALGTATAIVYWL